jgi:TolB protein
MSLVRGILLLCAVLVDSAPAAVPHKDRIIFQQISPTSVGLFLSDADGQNERPLIPATSRDYNAAFSADGKWIIFTSERAGPANIYRVRPDGSELEQLTASPSFDDQGALSPDGGTLAFVSTREGGTANIWLLDLASHHAVNLTNSNSGNFRPSWSPDGRWIAFTSDRDTPHRRIAPDARPPGGSGCCGWELLHLTAVYIVHPDGSNLRRLTPLDQSAESPKWSSDGKRLVYAEGIEGRETLQLASVAIESGARQVITNGAGDKSSPQYLNSTAIGYLQAVDGGKSVLAYTSGIKSAAGARWHPSWSPDGKLVVYEQAEFAPGFAARTGATPVLSPHASANSSFDFYRTDSCIAYLPDAQQLAMTNCFRNQKTLMVVNADGSGLRKVFDATAQNASIVSPSWSPDGRYIAFALAPRGLGTRNPISSAQIALIHSDGSNLRMLTRGDNNNAFPSFSPDGKHLVFRVLGAHMRGLRMVSLEDGKITTLTTEWDNFPQWSPRGDRIVFTSFRTGDFEIWSMRPDGSGLRQLTHDRGNDAHAIWSPDGTRILFTSSRMGWRDDTGGVSQSYGKLFVMRADGSALEQLTDNGWEQGPIAWLPPASMQSGAPHRQAGLRDYPRR